MPLLGNIIFVIGAVGIGLIAWKVLPKLFDETKNHFEFKDNADLSVLEPRCLSCGCRECGARNECEDGCVDCDENKLKN